MATTTATMSGTQFDALPYDEGRRWVLLGGNCLRCLVRRRDAGISSSSS